VPAFRANFVDGPWAGQSVTLDGSVPDFQVSRAGDPAKGTQDTIFVYAAGKSKMVNGIEEADFKISYDGPLHGRTNF